MEKVFNTNQIEDILVEIKSYADKSRSIITMTHQKSETVHQLTGLGGLMGLVPAMFTATANFTAGDTMTIDGVEYNIQLSDGGVAPTNLFVSGAVVPIVIDTTGKKVNFKFGGGGLSNNQLALATALPEDVVLGKTFYAGNDELKTGTLVPKAQYKSGTFTCTEYETVSISLPFPPRCVIAFIESEYSPSVALDCKMSNGKGFSAYPGYETTDRSSITISGNGFQIYVKSVSAGNLFGSYYAYG